MPALILLVAATLSATSDPVPETWFSTFLTADVPSGGYFKPVHLVHSPDRAQVASALPQAATVSYRANLVCGVRPTGVLFSCKPQQLWPDSPKTFSAVRMLVPSFKLSLADAALAKAHHAQILLTMYVDDDRRKIDRSCPPGWCPATPPPPPPPPPR